MRFFFDNVCNLAVPVVLRTLCVNRFVRGIFPPERKMVADSSKPAPILAVNDVPGELEDKGNDRAQDGSTIEKDAVRLVRVARQRKILP